MRVLIQRVSSASVEVDGNVIGEIGSGLLLLVGVGREDDASVLDPMLSKVLNLRIFNDEAGKMNLSVMDVGGELLVVSQFTLHADCRKGRRPSFVKAAPPDEGRTLFDRFVTLARSQVKKVETGQFGAHMNVSLVNDGPVTIWLDSEEIIK